MADKHSSAGDKEKTNMDFSEPDANEVAHCASEVTSQCESDFIEFGQDLCRDYQNAVNCIIQCESVIKNLEAQLISKDDEIASLEGNLAKSNRMSRKRLEEHLIHKDLRIANLEERIVQMSFELASTQAHEDRLQTKMKTSFTSISSNDSNQSQKRYTPLITSNCSKSLSESDQLKWSRVGLNSASSQDHMHDVCTSDAKASFTTNVAKPSFTNAPLSSKMSMSSKMSSMTTLSSVQTSFTSVNSSCRIRQGGWNLDDSNTSRFGLGQFLRKNCSWRQNPNQDDTATAAMNVQFPQVEDGGMDQSNSSRVIGKRRAPNQKRMALQKSSRSFLEARGVVFPVSSFEVLNKGCLDTRSVNKGGSKNEDWPEL